MIINLRVMAIDFKSAANNSFQSLASGVSSGIGSSIGGAIGGLMTKWFNPSAYKAAMRTELTGAEREQNAFNARQAEIARQFDLDLFNRQVELENSSFQRQVADMQKAGVNPALMYGGTSVSGAGTPSASSGAQASAVVSPADVNALVQLQMVGAQMRHINAQTGLVKAETKKTEEEAQGTSIDNLYKADYWETYLEQLKAGTDKIRSETDLARQKLKTEEFETAIKAKGLEMADIDLAIKANELVMSNIDKDNHQRLVDLSIRAAELANDKASAEIDEINAEIYLINQQALVAASQRGLIDANTKQALLQYGIDLETKDFTVSKAKAQAKEAEVSAKWATANQFINAGSKIVGAVASGVGAVGVANAAFNLFGKAVKKIGFK